MNTKENAPTEKRRVGRPFMAPPEERLAVNPLCELCNKNKRAKTTHLGKVYFRKYCHTCSDRRYKNRDKVLELARERSKRDYRAYCQAKMIPCHLCGFTPEHSCQMDRDHIDGNRYNNCESNIQIICANCHRLKTVKNKDYGRSKYKHTQVELVIGCGIIQKN